MTKVKICGITNLDDALHAAACGADELGFNFYEKSPRYILPEVAAEIIAALPTVISAVGVFVNHRVGEIVETVNFAGLRAVQLHGDETPLFVSSICRTLGDEVDTIKVIRVDDHFSVEQVLNYEADAILLDAFSSYEFGGTGTTFNWKLLDGVGAAIGRFYLAGGLSPKNVADAIRIARPYAVDACSLLESAPGRKDRVKVEQFIMAARSA